MRTILNILSRAGGWHPGLYLKVENLPYMELVIEAIDEPGPTGLPVISVAHYGEQNGDLMRRTVRQDLATCFGGHLDKKRVRSNPIPGTKYYSPALICRR